MTYRTVACSDTSKIEAQPIKSGIAKQRHLSRRLPSVDDQWYYNCPIVSESPLPAEEANHHPDTSVIAPELLSRRCKRLLGLTFCAAYLLSITIGFFIIDGRNAGRHLAAKLLAQGYAQRIQERLQSALVSTYLLASVVKQTGGRVTNFDDVAAETIALFPGVSSLSLAPDGVVREIYPLEGNQAAIGHDLLADRTRNRDAATAITTQQLTLGGPYDLVQGGVGTVGRLPIFLVNERNESHFWGFANALVLLPKLIEAAGFNGLIKAGYNYELWRTHPDTEERLVFSRSSSERLDTPVEYVITVHNGRWMLSIAPADGWTTSADYARMFAYSLLAALLVTLIQYLGIRTALGERK